MRSVQDTAGRGGAVLRGLRLKQSTNVSVASLLICPKLFACVPPLMVPNVAAATRNNTKRWCSEHG